MQELISRVMLSRLKDRSLTVDQLSATQLTQYQRDAEIAIRIHHLVYGNLDKLLRS